MDALERWRQGWDGTRQIVVANRPGGAFSDESRAVIADAGLDLVETSLRNEQGVLSEAVENAEVLVSSVGLDADVFKRLRRTRFVLRPYVGYDDIDVEAASEQGILVGNVPDTFVEEVANHAMALILATNRRLQEMDRFVREGRWAAGEAARELARPMRRLSTMTLGLVGFGNIGRLVATRAAPFGFRVLAADPYVPADVAAQFGATLVPLDQLMRDSDIVSVHVFLSKETRHLLDAERMSLMKPTAVLVNTSRGPVVDEAALADALKAGRISAAALDVFETEPLDATSPLTKMDNVLLAPHLASFSDEGEILHRKRVGHLAVQAANGLPERKVVIDKDLYDRIAALPELARVKRH